MNDPRLTDVNKRLREVNQEISDLAWDGASPDAMQSLLLEREWLEHEKNKGTLYVPNF